MSITIRMALMSVSLLLFLHSTITNQQSIPHSDHNHLVSTTQHVSPNAQVSAVYLPMAIGTEPSRNTTLLASYVVQSPQPDYHLLRYRPRQFNNGLDADSGDQIVQVDQVSSYAGWDVLNTPNTSINVIADDPDWLVLTLNRPATLAVVWRDKAEAPNWLQSWQKGADVVINGKSVPTYIRQFPAGRVTLGGVYDLGATVTAHRDTYLVLFAESGGVPSQEPSVPVGREVPKPNQLCPAWVHDSYTTVGPDGKNYPTWHPQIDPVYWCYFGHEHGSDPSLFDPAYKPAYGYTATQHAMEEGHAGFKTYVVDDRSGHRWLINHHFGTGSIRRACARFHTLEFAVRDKSTNTLLADIRFMADFGPSVVNTTQEPLRPAECPDQAKEAETSKGVRQIPVGTREANPYEPWRPDHEHTVFGLDGSFVVNTPEGVVICNDVTCDAPTNGPTNTMGVFRFLMFSGPFGIKAGANTGTFYTDPMGTQLLQADSPGAIKQYVQPGTNAVFVDMAVDEECYPTDMWRAQYVCSKEPSIQRSMSLEESIIAPN
jgi:hypothetical protein